MNSHTQDLFSTPGTLSLSVGAGYLTAFEVANLKAGDIVKSATVAGEPAVAYFNGSFLLSAEVVILTDVFGFRVVGFSPPGSSDPGRLESAAEILPFVLRLGSVEMTLEELQGIAVGSVVSLDKLFSTDEDAELVVAGIPIAAGKVDAVHENVGFRVTRVFGSGAAPGLEPLSSGNVLTAEGETVYARDYNFKRPDKFSKYAIDRIVGVHRLFAQNLNLRLAAWRDVEIVGDQWTIAEALESLSATPVRYLLAHNSAPGPRPQPSKTTRPYVEPRNAAHPAPDDVRKLVERVTQEGSGGVLDAAIIAISSDEALAVLIEDEREFLFSALRGAWRSAADIRLVFDRVAADAEDAQVVNPNEMVLTMAVRDGREPQRWLMVIYPYLTLAPYHGLLG